MYKDCIRLANGIIQFRPFIVAYDASGTTLYQRLDDYCYLSLPDAEVPVTAELPNLPAKRADNK